MSNTRDIELTVSIDAPPDAVWRALTEGEELSKWFAPEARVTPGVGGKIWLSWGEGMEAESPIEIFDAPKHLRTRSGENKETKAPLWIDYVVGSEGATTTLRLVHSGFSQGADWDEEFDSHLRGWKVFLENLRNYLELHRGERVVQKTFDARFLPDRATVFRALMAANLADDVQVITPERDFGFTVKDSGGAVVRISLEKSTKIVTRPDGESTWLYCAVIGYGERADEAAALADRFSAAICSAVG